MTNFHRYSAKAGLAVEKKCAYRNGNVILTEDVALQISFIACHLNSPSSTSLEEVKALCIDAIDASMLYSQRIVHQPDRGSSRDYSAYARSTGGLSAYQNQITFEKLNTSSWR